MVKKQTIERIYSGLIVALLVSCIGVISSGISQLFVGEGFPFKEQVGYYVTWVVLILLIVVFHKKVTQ